MTFAKLNVYFANEIDNLYIGTDFRVGVTEQGLKPSVFKGYSWGMTRELAEKCEDLP
jgi:hypothetical protein